MPQDDELHSQSRCCHCDLHVEAISKEQVLRPQHKPDHAGHVIDARGNPEESEGGS